MAIVLAACGAGSFTVGSAHTASASAAGGAPGTSVGVPSSSSAGHVGSEAPIDDTDPVTAGTIAANRSYTGPAEFPPGTDGPGSYSQAYGPPGARRGPGYYEDNGQKWTILAGFTVEEATRRARATGFDGEIETKQVSDYRADCKLGTVCGVTPLRWQLNIEHTLTLWVNPKLKISSPE